MWLATILIGAVHGAAQRTHAAARSYFSCFSNHSQLPTKQHKIGGIINITEIKLKYEKLKKHEQNRNFRLPPKKTLCLKSLA